MNTELNIYHSAQVIVKRHGEDVPTGATLSPFLRTSRNSIDAF